MSLSRALPDYPFWRVGASETRTLIPRQYDGSGAPLDRSVNYINAA